MGRVADRQTLAARDVFEDFIELATVIWSWQVLPRNPVFT